MHFSHSSQISLYTNSRIYMYLNYFVIVMFALSYASAAESDVTSRLQSIFCARGMSFSSIALARERCKTKDY